MHPSEPIWSVCHWLKSSIESEPATIKGYHAHHAQNPFDITKQHSLTLVSSGCAEASADSMYYCVERGKAHSYPPTSVIPAGFPIDNTYIAIVDSGLSSHISADDCPKQKHKTCFMPVEKGIEGEIWIGGLGLAVGYTRNDASLTKRFVEIDAEEVKHAVKLDRSITGVDASSCQSRKIRFFQTGDRGHILGSGK